MTAKVGAVTVFTLSLNPATGGYTYTQYRTIDQLGQQSINVTIKDKDGDTVTVNAAITLDLSAPQAEDRFVMYTGSTATNINGKAITGNIIFNDADTSSVLQSVSNGVYGTATFNALTGEITYTLAANAATLMGTGSTPIKDYITYTALDSANQPYTKTIEVVVVRQNTGTGQFISPNDVDGETHQTYLNVSGDSNAATQEVNTSDGRDVFRATHLEQLTVDFKDGDDVLIMDHTTSNLLQGGNVKMGDGNDSVMLKTTSNSYAMGAGAVLDLGTGKDTVQLINTNIGTSAVSMLGASIIGSGSDGKLITANAALAGLSSSSSITLTGTGADTISITSGSSYAVGYSSTIDAGDGDNSISLNAQTSGLGVMTNSATVKTGTGSDTVSVTGKIGMDNSKVETGAGNDSITVTSTATNSMQGGANVLAGTGNDSASITGLITGGSKVDMGDGTDHLTLSGVTAAQTTVVSGTGTMLDGGTGNDVVTRDPGNSGAPHELGDMVTLTHDLALGQTGGSYILGGLTNATAATQNVKNFEALHLELTGGSGDQLDMDQLVATISAKKLVEAGVNSVVITGDPNDLVFPASGWTEIADGVLIDGFGAQTFKHFTTTINGQTTHIYVESGSGGVVLPDPDDRFVMYTGSAAANINNKAITGDIIFNDTDTGSVIQSVDSSLCKFGTATFNAVTGEVTYTLKANASTLMGTGTTTIREYITYTALDSANQPYTKTIEVVIVRKDTGTNQFISPNDVDGETHQTYISTGLTGDSVNNTPEVKTSDGKDVFRSDKTIYNAEIDFKDGDDLLVVEGAFAVEKTFISMGDGNDTVNLTSASSSIHNSTLDLGEGDNVASMAVIGSAASFIAGINADGAGTTASLKAGDGNNSITISSTMSAITSNYGVATLETGAGNDTISLTGVRYGIYSNSQAFFDAGDGDNVITITGKQGTRGNVGISTGSGADSIVITGTGDDAMETTHLESGAGNDTITVVTQAANGYALRASTIEAGAGDDIASVTGQFGVTSKVDMGDGADRLTLSGATAAQTIVAGAGTGTMLDGGTGNDAVVRTGTHQLGDVLTLTHDLAMAKTGGAHILGGLTNATAATQNVKNFEALHLDLANGGGSDTLDAALLLKNIGTRKLVEAGVNSIVITGDATDTLMKGLDWAPVGSGVSINGFAGTFDHYTAQVNGQTTHIYVDSAVQTWVPDDRFVMYTGSTAANINSKAITGNVTFNDTGSGNVIQSVTNGQYGTATFNALTGEITYVLSATAATLMGAGTGPVRDVITYTAKDAANNTYTKTVEVVIVRQDNGTNQFISPDDVDGETHQTYIPGGIIGDNTTGTNEAAASAGNDVFRFNEGAHGAEIKLGNGDNAVSMNTAGTGFTNSSITAGSGKDTITLSKTGAGAVIAGGTTIDAGAGDDSITITGSMGGYGIQGGSSSSTRAVVLSGEGDDTISVTGGTAMKDYAAVVGGDGDDLITVTGGNNAGNYGMDGVFTVTAETIVNGGDGANTITVSGYSAMKNAAIYGGENADSITVTATATTNGVALEHGDIMGTSNGTPGAPDGNDTVRITGAITNNSSIYMGMGADRLYLAGTDAGQTSVIDGTSRLDGVSGGDSIVRTGTHELGDIVTLSHDLSVAQSGGSYILGGLTGGGMGNTRNFEALHLELTDSNGTDLIDMNQLVADLAAKNLVRADSGGDNWFKSIVITGDAGDQYMPATGWTQVGTGVQINGFASQLFNHYTTVINGEVTHIYVDSTNMAALPLDDRFVMYTGANAGDINGKAITGRVTLNDGGPNTIVSLANGGVGTYGTATFNALTGEITYTLDAAAAALMGAGTTQVKDYISYTGTDGKTRYLEVVVVRDVSGDNQFISDNKVHGETHQTYVQPVGDGNAATPEIESSDWDDRFTSFKTGGIKGAVLDFKDGNDNVQVQGNNGGIAIENSSISLGDGGDIMIVGADGGTATLLKNSVVHADAGNDWILAGAKLDNSQIYGDTGNDYIRYDGKGVNAFINGSFIDGGTNDAIVRPIADNTTHQLGDIAGTSQGSDNPNLQGGTGGASGTVRNFEGFHFEYSVHGVTPQSYTANLNDFLTELQNNNLGNDISSLIFTNRVGQTNASLTVLTTGWTQVAQNISIANWGWNTDRFDLYEIDLGGGVKKYAYVQSNSTNLVSLELDDRFVMYTGGNPTDIDGAAITGNVTFNDGGVNTITGLLNGGVGKYGTATYNAVTGEITYTVNAGAAALMPGGTTQVKDYISYTGTDGKTRYLEVVVVRDNNTGNIFRSPNDVDGETHQSYIPGGITGDSLGGLPESRASGGDDVFRFNRGATGSQFELGNGDNTVTMSGNVDGFSGSAFTAGTGDDLIELKSTKSGALLNNTSIVAGDGNNTITLVSADIAANTTTIGGVGIAGGSGNDSITLVGSMNAGGYGMKNNTSFSAAGAIAYGGGNDTVSVSGHIAMLNSVIYGNVGSGNDLITITGSMSAGGAGFKADGTTTSWASIQSYTGDDTILVSGFIGVTGAGTVGTNSPYIDGGFGDDSIVITGSMSAGGVGAKDILYIGGNDGNDTITVSGAIGLQKTSTGSTSCYISGDLGNDSITISGGNNAGDYGMLGVNTSPTGKAEVKEGGGTDSDTINVSGHVAAKYASITAAGSGGNVINITSTNTSGGTALEGSMVGTGTGNDTVRITGNITSTGVYMGTGADRLYLSGTDAGQTSVLGTSAAISGDNGGDVIVRTGTHELGDIVTLEHDLAVAKSGGSYTLSNMKSSAGWGSSAMTVKNFEALHLELTNSSGGDMLDMNQLVADIAAKKLVQADGFDSSSNACNGFKSIVVTGDVGDSIIIPGGWAKIGTGVQVNGFTQTFNVYTATVNGELTHFYVDATGPTLIELDDRFVMYTGSNAADINGAVITGSVTANDASIYSTIQSIDTSMLQYGTASFNAVTGEITYTINPGAAALMGGGTTPIKEYVTYTAKDSSNNTYTKMVEIVIVRANNTNNLSISSDDVYGETHHNYIQVNGDNVTGTQEIKGSNGHDVFQLAPTRGIRNAEISLGAGDDTMRETSGSWGTALNNVKLDLGTGRDFLYLAQSGNLGSSVMVDNTIITGSGSDDWNDGKFIQFITSDWSGGGIVMRSSGITTADGSDNVFLRSSGTGGVAMSASQISTGAGNDTISIQSDSGSAMTNGSRVDAGSGNDQFRINGAVTQNSRVDMGIGRDTLFLGHTSSTTSVDSSSLLDGGTGGDTIVRSGTHQLGDMLSLEHDLALDMPGGVYSLAGLTGANTQNFEALHLEMLNHQTDVLNLEALAANLASKQLVKADSGGNNWIKSVVVTGDAGDYYQPVPGWTLVNNSVQIDGFGGQTFKQYTATVNGQTTHFYVESTLSEPVVDDRFVFAPNVSLSMTGKVIFNDADPNSVLLSVGSGSYGTATFNAATGEITYTAYSNYATLMGAATTVKDYITYTAKDSANNYYTKILEVDLLKNSASFTSPNNVNGETWEWDRAGLGASSLSDGNDTLYVHGAGSLTGIVDLRAGNDYVEISSSAATAVNSGTIKLGAGDDTFIIQGGSATSGLVNATLDLGTGKDVVSISVVSSSISTGSVYGSTITGSGTDAKHISLTSNGWSLFNSNITLGDGDNTIELLQTVYSGGGYVGAMGQSAITTGSGNDYIKISGETYAMYGTTTSGNMINTGAGDDYIRIEHGRLTTSSWQNKIIGGAGDDTLSLNLGHLNNTALNQYVTDLFNGTNSVTQMENIFLDLRGTGITQSLSLDANRIAGLSNMGWQNAGSIGTGVQAGIYIQGTTADTVNVKDTGITWTNHGAVTEDGITYNHWKDNAGHDIYVQQQITLITM